MFSLLHGFPISFPILGPLKYLIILVFRQVSISKEKQDSFSIFFRSYFNNNNKMWTFFAHFSLHLHVGKHFIISTFLHLQFFLQPFSTSTLFKYSFIQILCNHTSPIDTLFYYQWRTMSNLFVTLPFLPVCAMSPRY